MSNTKAGLLQKIILMSTDDEREYIYFDQPSLPIPYYSDNAILIDITNHIPKYFELQTIIFFTENIPNSTLNIDIEDKERSCKRPLESNKMLFSGDKISIPMKEQSIGTYYSIQIR